MADLTPTSAQVLLLDEKTMSFKTGGNGYAAGDTVTVVAGKTYANAASQSTNIAIGKTNDSVVFADSLQRMSRVVGAFAFILGNRMGYDAIIDGKTPNQLGTAL